MAIQACPRCGSTKLRMPQFRDGVVADFDNLNDYVCETCDLRANPIVFDRQSDYDAFVSQLNE